MKASKPIDILKDLATFIIQPSLTARDVAVRLGRIVDDQRGQLMIETETTSFATVVTQLDSDEPSYVQLVFNEPVTLAALQEAFGKYQELPRMPRKESQVMFRPEQTGGTHRAAIISVLEGESARTFTIRRDISLE